MMRDLMTLLGARILLVASAVLVASPAAVHHHPIAI
jgi:hypothetical protein